MSNRYSYQEFPRVVYGPNGVGKVIDSEDERPDGWTNTPGEQAADAKDAKEDADKAAEDAGKALREELKAFLDEHGVDYAKNLSTPKLQDLADQLTEHLKAQNDGDGK